MRNYRNYKDPILNKNGNPLKILMASNHCCVRVIKLLRSLKKIGYKIDGLANKMSYGTEDFDVFATFQNKDQMKNYLRDNKDKYDLIYYATEPDWPVKVIKDIVGPNIPVIADLHDLDSIRREFVPIPEREMFNAADGFIYVSKPIQEKANKLHAVTKPNICLYSYCNEGIVKYDEDKIGERKGLVYEGGINPPNNKEMCAAFPYRSLYDIMKKLVEMRNELHMFCGNLDGYHTYQNIGAVLYPPTDYTKMMEAMTKFKYGVLIFNNKEKTEQQVNLTLTNKEEEYLQCGLPSLACWCEESMKHVKKWKIGFTFNDIEDIGNTSQLEDKYLTIMDNIKRVRKKLVMEGFIFKLENLMAELLGVGKKGVPKRIENLNIKEYGKEETYRILGK